MFQSFSIHKFGIFDHRKHDYPLGFSPCTAERRSQTEIVRWMRFLTDLDESVGSEGEVGACVDVNGLQRGEPSCGVNHCVRESPFRVVAACSPMPLIVELDVCREKLVVLRQGFCELATIHNQCKVYKVSHGTHLRHAGFNAKILAPELNIDGSLSTRKGNPSVPSLAIRIRSPITPRVRHQRQSSPKGRGDRFLVIFVESLAADGDSSEESGTQRRERDDIVCRAFSGPGRLGFIRRVDENQTLSALTIDD